MKLFRITQSSQWWLIAGAGAVAIVVWGTYVWIFTRSSPTPETAPPESLTAATPNPSADQALPTPSLTSLRATHAAAQQPDADFPSDRPSDQTRSRSEDDLSSSIRANAPISLDNAIGVTIVHPQLDRPPPPPDTSKANAFLPSPGQNTASALAELESARSARAHGDLITARASYARALNLGLPDPEGMAIRSELATLAESLLFSRAIDPEDPFSFSHHVGRGESLDLIAKRNRITGALLSSINRITDPNRLRAGARLKVVRGPFNAIIWKSAHRLDAFLGDTYIRSFRVGLGTNGGTPLGRWFVKNKLENPAWTDPGTGRYYAAADPDNPIGERWIGIECVEGGCLGREGFGIHGTIEPQSIGENMSMGCVRLVPEDVALLYDLLVERHSHIDIRP